jgi:hypothetical protein
MWDTYTMMTRAEAIAQVSLFVSAQSYPQMSTTDIGSILDSFSRFTTWAAATTYAVGDRIVPTTPNGRVYEARVAGTSGATQPTFPVYAPYQVKGFSLEDGTGDPTLMWVDYGPINVERYDVRTATRQAWLIKASRVAADIDAKEGTSDVKLSQLMQHCLEMANRFRPVVFA